MWPPTPHDGLKLPDGRSLGTVDNETVRREFDRLKIPGFNHSLGRLAAIELYAKHLAAIGKAGADAAIAVISPKCAFELDEAELDLQQIGDYLKEAFHVCQPDITKLCGETRPGEGRISACLASNRASVLQSCVDAIEKLQIK
jgi:hypothetical protein